MLGLSTGIKISILSESGHSTFVLCIKRESIDVERHTSTQRHTRQDVHIHVM